jgi:thioredoxin reductase
MGYPVPLDTVTAYGLAFQKRFVPDLEERMVEALGPAPAGFSLRLDDGETLIARRVVVATGISNYQYLPEVFAHLPHELLTHSFGHRDLSRFKGRDVTVIGAGASALEIASALNSVGANARLVARRRAIRWTAPPLPLDRPLWDRIRYPMSGMTPGLRARFYEDAPLLFRYIPAWKRIEIVKTFLGPAPAWWVKEQVGKVPWILGATPERAEEDGGRVRLTLSGGGDIPREIVTDHVIAATGFHVDIARLPFLGTALRNGLKTIDMAPTLSTNFESSVPGLYFVGLASAYTFGPLMRFMLGTKYAATRLSRHLAQSAVDQSVAGPAVAMGPARA